MQIGDRLETVFHGIELNQCHILLVRIAQNLYCLDLSVFAEDVEEHVLLADIFFDGAHMQGQGRTVNCQGSMRSVSKWRKKYRSDV